MPGCAQCSNQVDGHCRLQSRIEDAELLKPWELKRREYKQKKKMTANRDKSTLAAMQAFSKTLAGLTQSVPASAPGPPAGKQSPVRVIVGHACSLVSVPALSCKGPLQVCRCLLLQATTSGLWLHWERLTLLCWTCTATDSFRSREMVQNSSKWQSLLCCTVGVQRPGPDRH